ncbi:hypothetical protein [Pseudokineococcus sp. 1T1Z-3]|uniref:hypothetical protein n=1 Tax=Pseudokineococcus sp. 1T1Z-3 TaxID=3132745 RepID=UPI0030AAF2FF
MSAGPDEDLLPPGGGEPRRAGAHRASPTPVQRLAPVGVVLALAALAVLVVTLWFAQTG